MLPFSPTVADQIRYLVQSCNDSNFDSVLSQLCEFAEYGSEGNILLLQTCLDQIDFHGMSTNVPVKPDIVSSVLRYLMERPHFSTVFCEATRKASSDDTFLNNLSKALNLSIFEKFGVSLALADSENLDHRVRGQSFCLSLIEELCENSTSSFSHELIRDVVMFLYRSEGLSKHVDSFTKILSLLDTKESLPFLLSPIVSGDLREVDSTRHLYLFEEGSESDFDLILSEIEKEISMADVMGELGYGCTVDISRCIDMLSLFLPLTEVTIAKLLGTIIRTRVGHEDNLNLYSTFSTAFGCNVTSDASPSTWNINVLVDSIRKLAPATNWMHVFENLDHESFYIPDSESFSFFMSLYSYACQNPFPLYTICGCVWQNAEGQLSFLRHAVSAPPEVFTFAHSERKLTHIDPIYDPSGHGNQAWHSLELLDVLCELAERGHAVAVREMLQYPIKECPELLLLGIIHSQTAYNLLQYEVFTTMFPDVLKKSKSGLVNHLWHANSSLVLHGFLHAYSMDTESIVRILSISEELKILSCILDSAPVSFSIRLAAIASQKELIDLEKWLNENVREHKDAFFEVALQFLKDNLANAKTNVPRDTSDTSEGSNISQDSCQKVLKVFQAHLGQIASPQLSEEVRKFYSSLLDPGRQSAGAIEMSAEGNTDDVEIEANTYFHQMFSGQLSIDMMIQTLGRFKEYPDDKREKRIFDCMIGNLFEEYKFFPKYPDRQLKIAAILFGSLIKNQLVTHLTLGIALRCVLDALRKSVDSKMFLFGAKALEQFRERLVEWPQYCNHILQISHLRNTHSELVLFIERALARISSSQSDSNGASAINIEHPQSSSPASIENIEALHPGIQYSSSFQQQQRNQDLVGDRVKSAPVVNNVKPTLSSSVLAPHGDSANNQKTTTTQSLQATQPPTGVSTAASSSPGFARPRVTAPSGVLRQSYSTGFGAALNIETLVAAAERRDTPIEAPASETQDKIHFIINNISAANVDTKSKEFLDILKEEYYPWFAEYMVMKRASIEPNFHDLYLKFLEKISSRTLNKEIVKATYENCKVLLRSDLIKSSSEERSLLKNLGSWLGKFTIGRNQALRAREIDPKVLIMEAYERGLMIAVIPFTSKILEPCQCSLAYQPPNPWTMAILGLLVEIYNLPNLKMNLKFDIEVLFKNLGVDMKDVKPTSLLKDRTREIEGNPDFSNKDISSSQTLVIAESNSALISPLNQFEIQTQVTNASHPGGHPSGLSQYTGPLHMSLSMIEDDDKSGSLSISERGLSGLGQSQVTPSASSFTINQPLTPISNISSHIVINTKLSALGLQMHLQRIIPLAMERAVAEIISAVVTRSVTISLQTTKELVQKDYSMETDENRIRNAAKLMVSSLAGSLAHVTCKEPLRMSLSTHLRNLLQTLNVSNDLLEQTIQIITNDNLDLGCALVEQSATEKALQNIEVDIGPFIAYKKKQRESSGSYYDAAAYAQGTFARVPESLRPKPGHLSNNQQRVYEEFVKYPWHNQSSQNQSVNPTSGQLASSGVSLNSTLARGYGSGSGQLHPGIYTMSSAAPGLVGVPQSSDLVSDVIDPGSMQILSVPPTHTAADDVSANQAAETISVVPSYSPASQELLITDSFPAIKELGAVVPPPTAATERTGASVTETSTVEDVLDKYHVLAQKLENLILLKDLTESDVQNLIQEAAMELHEALLMCTSRDEAALSVSQKIFKRLYENASNSLQVGAHLQLLGAVRDVCPLVVKEITNWVVFSDEEWKFNKDITIGLIQMELLNLADYDVHLAKLIDGGRNRVALEFVISLLPTLLNQEPGFSISEFYNLMDVLTKLAQRPGSPESLHQLIDMAKHSISSVISLPGTNVSREERHRQIRDKRGAFARQAPNIDECIGSDSLGADPAGLHEVHEQASLSFAEWFRICESPTSDAAATHFISQLQQRVFLKGDEFTERFFRVVTELSVLHCLASEQVTHSQQAPVLSFVAVDILAKLVVQILKYSVDQSSSKIALLPKILSVVARAMQKDAEEKKTSFNSRPYFRLFFDLLMDLPSPDSIVDGWNFQVLTLLANCLHALQPAKVPGFSFAWLELVSHRSFMPKLLMVNGQKGWPFFQRLLVDMLKFIEPYVRSANLGEPVLFLYKGTLRMLLVLLHDFPEFLCDYHFSLCDVIPSSCIQMRNIILSAFPVNMRLPDPCTPNLKIDLLPEITQSPRILSDIDGALKSKQIKADLDEYLKIKNHGSFLTDLKQRLLLPSHEVLLAGTHYNIPLINSLVLYVGMQAIQQLQNNVSSQHVPTQGAQSGPLDIFLVGAAMDVFNHLMQDLDAEGRYIFLNAVANQLRYPNNHTHYFSFVLLYLFVEAKEEIIQEQITRVLLERLIVNRPHPWGLLITFIELIKNPRYDFWSKQFIHCAPEIENLFDQVSRSCGGGSRGVVDDLVSVNLSSGVH